MKLIHIDISGPMTPSVIGDDKDFNTFIDDYFICGWAKVFNEKSETLDAFKIFKITLEHKLEKKIKCVNFTEAMSIMVGMVRQEETLVFLLNTYKNVG